MHDLLKWPKLEIPARYDPDAWAPWVLHPEVWEWGWLAFSFNGDSLVDLRGVCVLVPDLLVDELEAAQYLLYRAMERRLLGEEEIRRVFEVSGKNHANLLANVFRMLGVRHNDRERVLRRICRYD